MRRLQELSGGPTIASALLMPGMVWHEPHPKSWMSCRPLFGLPGTESVCASTELLSPQAASRIGIVSAAKPPIMRRCIRAMEIKRSENVGPRMVLYRKKDGGEQDPCEPLVALFLLLLRRLRTDADGGRIMAGRLLTGGEGLRMLPGLGRIHELRRHLLDRGQALGEISRRAPLRARGLADALDISGDVPDYALGKHTAPGRHALRSAVCDHVVHLRGIGAEFEEAVTK